MRRKKTIFLALGLIAFTLLFLWADWYEGTADRRRTSSVYNHSPLGVHIFYDLARKIRPESVAPYRKIFRKETLDPSMAVLILSPKKKIKGWEAKILQEFVQGGGRLILSFEDESAWENLQGLVALLEGPSSLRKDEGFKNFQTAALNPAAATPFFRPEETYTFYSRYWIDRPECQKGNFECFVFEKGVGEGSFLLTAGLPLVANSMIGLADNRRFAFRLIDSSAKLILDEYHHYFSDHTFGQMLKKPGFAIPFFSMIACVILFFLFGHSSFHELTRFEKRKAFVPGYHSLGEKILLDVLDLRPVYPGALSLHQSFLEKIFPYAKMEIQNAQRQVFPENKDAFLRQAFHWVKIHQNLLEKKRGFGR